MLTPPVKNYIHHEYKQSSMDYKTKQKILLCIHSHVDADDDNDNCFSHSISFFIQRMKFKVQN